MLVFLLVEGIAVDGCSVMGFHFLSMNYNGQNGEIALEDYNERGGLGNGVREVLICVICWLQLCTMLPTSP